MNRTPHTEMCEGYNFLSLFIPAAEKYNEKEQKVKEKTR